MVGRDFKPLIKLDDAGEPPPGGLGVRAVEPATDLPAIAWMDAAESPWGVPVLDARPLALGYMSFSLSGHPGEHVQALMRDDGVRFIGAAPDRGVTVESKLRYRIDPLLADGALFLPMDTEDRWAIYHHERHIICVDSWQGLVRVVAEVRTGSDDGGAFAAVRRIHGSFVGEDDALRPRVLDYLIRTHAMMKIHPVPLPPCLAGDPLSAARWAKDHFGRRALFATPHGIPAAAAGPLPPLRTYSLLHFAAADADHERVAALLEDGLPADLPDWRGFTPLFCALDDEGAVELLLDGGATVDARAADGSTALMYAVLRGRLEQVRLLLEHGADPDARDDRAFTALHRAADLDRPAIARMLLRYGACADPVASGYTPYDIARAMGHERVIELLRRA